MFHKKYFVLSLILSIFLSLDLKGTKVVVLDLDGTMADTCIKCAKSMIDFANYWKYTKKDGTPASMKDLENFRDLSAEEITTELGMGWIGRAACCVKVRKDMRKDIDKIEIVPGITDVIKQLYENNFILAVLTSNTEENARLFLRKHGIEKYFETVYSGWFWQVFNKASMLDDLIKRLKINPQDAIYIGDEARDLKAVYDSKTLKKFIGVEWGYNTYIAFINMIKKLNMRLDDKDKIVLPYEDGWDFMCYRDEYNRTDKIDRCYMVNKPQYILNAVAKFFPETELKEVSVSNTDADEHFIETE